MDFNSSSQQQSTSNLPVDKQTEPSFSVLSSPIIIPMISDSNPSISNRSLKKKSSVKRFNEHSNVNGRKSTLAKHMSMTTLKNQLHTRDSLYHQLATVSNIMCFLGILGIILMIVENELIFNNINNQDTEATWFIKLIITITTVILLIFIFYYHYLNIKLHSLRNSIVHWYVELTPRKVLWIIIEILICIIHPVPRYYPQSASQLLNLNSTILNSSLPTSHLTSYTAIDVGLGLPMFLRLYLLGRVIMFQSDLVRNVSLRSFGYLNQVSINFFFLMKTYLEQWPTRFMIVICTFIFFIGSWSLHACDFTNNGEHRSMSNAMWLFVMTFTTIGYGDIYPSTYCGRIIAAIIGLFGLFSTALLIAILALKLLLTREEKYVHTFVSNIQLAEKHKKQAANIIKFSIKVWYLKRKNKSKSISYFQIQGKLFRSIHCFQKTKQIKHNLVDRCLGFNELMTIQQNTSAQTEEIVEQMMTNKTEIKEIKEKLNYLCDHMEILQNTLQVLLNKNGI